ncbi:MAG: hypothetical protein ACE5KH_05005 [Candidatus Geothermarchaeales archaeon]
MPEFFAHFEGGGTLQQLAQYHDITLDELMARIMERARQHLVRLAEAGEISRDEIPHLLDQLREEILRELESPSPPTVYLPEDPPLEIGYFPFDFEAIAHALGLSPEEFHHLLSEGYTLRELAEEKGISLQDILQIVMIPMEQKLQSMVEAGHISEDEARAMLEKMRFGALRALEEFQVRIRDEIYPDQDEFRPDPSFRPYPEIPLTFADAAQVLGVSFEEMMERMGDGDHVLDFLEERGFTLESFAAALVDLVSQRLDVWVMEGEIPEVEAVHILQELKERLLQDLGGPHTVRSTQIDPDYTYGYPLDVAMPFSFEDLAHILALPLDELEHLLSQGYTVAEIAGEAGISLEELVSNLIVPLEAKIQQLFAEGHLTEDDAIAKLREARTTILRALEEFRVTVLDTPYPGDTDFSYSIVNQIELSPGITLEFSVGLHEIAEVLGLSPEEFSRYLGEGYTIPEVANSLGTSLEDLVYILLDASRAKLYGLVETGYLSEEDALALLHQLEAEVQEMIAHMGAPTPDAEAYSGETYTGDISLLPFLSGPDDLFLALGIDLEKVYRLTAEGLTVAEAAHSLGLDPATIYERLNVMAQERVASAISDGFLTSQDAAPILRQFQDQVEELIAKFFVLTSSTGTSSGGTSTGDSTTSDTTTTETGTTDGTATEEKPVTSTSG